MAERMTSDKGVLQFSSGQPREQSAAPKLAKAILVPSWQRARDLSCSAVLAGEMCVVVTGLPGTGKTLLVDTVARALQSTGWTVVTSIARLPSNDEFAALTGSAAILIDDADRLSATELRTLNRLRQCSVLLAGAVGLEKRCPADSRVTLAPLSLDEVETYVGSWLEQSGLDPDLIAEPTTLHLAEVSAGIPRALRILLAGALKGARAEGSEQIEEHHIDNAAWHHVEHTSARLLKQALSAPEPANEPKRSKPAPARPDLEQRLSQAPFADPHTTDARVPSRVLGLAGVSVAVIVAAGFLTWDHWSQWATSAYNGFVAVREAVLPAPIPARVSAATPAQTRTDTTLMAASTKPGEEPSKPAEIQSLRPVEAIPFEPPGLTPVEPVRSIVAATPQASPEAPDVRAAPSASLMAAQSQSSLPPTFFPEPLPPEVIQLLNQRGQQMIDLNDYSAARLLFSRAAESGSIKAMLALGRSYDPTIIDSGASKSGSDPAQAGRWYRKAAALGNSDAAILLRQLERGARE